jgi:hypothetical protein
VFFSIILIKRENTLILQNSWNNLQFEIEGLPATRRLVAAATTRRAEAAGGGRVGARAATRHGHVVLGRPAGGARPRRAGHRPRPASIIMPCERSENPAIPRARPRVEVWCEQARGHFAFWAPRPRCDGAGAGAGRGPGQPAGAPTQRSRLRAACGATCAASRQPPHGDGRAGVHGWPRRGRPCATSDSLVFLAHPPLHHRLSRCNPFSRAACVGAWEIATWDYWDVLSLMMGNGFLLTCPIL